MNYSRSTGSSAFMARYGVGLVLSVFVAVSAGAQSATYDPVYGGQILLSQAGGTSIAFLYDVDGFSPAHVSNQTSGAQFAYAYSAGGHRLVRTDITGTDPSHMIDLGAARFRDSGGLEYFLPGNRYIYSDPGAATSETLTFVADRQGSVRGLIDQSGGVVQRFGYGVAGAVTDEASLCGSDAICASAVGAFDLRREQLQYREALALYDNNARFYDPASQRFGQRDPAGQSVSPYSSRRGDPVNYIDRNGAEPDFAYYPTSGIEKTIRNRADVDTVAQTIMEFADIRGNHLTPYDVNYINQQSFAGNRDKTVAYQLYMKSSKNDLASKDSNARRKIFDDNFFPFVENDGKFEVRVGDDELRKFLFTGTDQVPDFWTGIDSFGIVMTVSEKNHLFFAVNAQGIEERQTLGRSLGVKEATGTHLFALGAYAIHKELDIQSITSLTGEWMAAKSVEDSTNYHIFSKYFAQTKDPVWAANNTPTGKWASRFLGLSLDNRDNIEGIDKNEITDDVWVTFQRPLRSPSSESEASRKRGFSQISGGDETIYPKDLPPPR